MGRKTKNPGLMPSDIAEHENIQALKRQIRKDPAYRTITEKEKAFAVEMLAHPNKTPKEQLIAAGYSPNMNPDAVRRQIKGKLRKTFEEIGLFEDDLGRVAKDGLYAEKHIFFKRKRTIKGKGDKPDVTEEYLESIAVPDLAMRHKYFESIVRLAGYNPASKIDINSTRHETLELNVNVAGALENISQEALEASVLADQERRLLESKEAEFEVVEEEKKNTGRESVRRAV